MPITLIQKGDLAATSFANSNSNNAGGISIRVDAGSVVKAAIDAAMAGLPGDKFLQGLASYNAVTNELLLNMSDGSTVTVNMTSIVNDAVASAIASAVPAYGNDGTTVLGRWFAA